MPGAYDELHSTLQLTLMQRLGWCALRPLQEETYEAASTGADLLVIAPTAGGKTEAAMIPVVDRALKDGAPGVYCIYLSPLKALINDQLDRVSRLCTPGRLTAAAFHGDVPMADRRCDPDDEPHVLLITPESLEVMLHSPASLRRFAPLRFVVIDEVHAFVGSDRGVQVRCLLDRLDRAAGRSVQRIGLSATVGNPDAVLSWLSGPGRSRSLVRVESPPAPRHFSFHLEPDEQMRADAIIKLVRGRRSLLFVRSRSEVERLSTHLDGRIPGLYCHHSSVSPATRANAERAAKEGEPFCIVCTSTLELGIDIGDLDRVVQLGPPSSVASFLQRLGRTGRRDRPARFAFLLSRPCELLLALGAVEAAMRGEAEPVTPPSLPYHILAQQVLLALTARRRTTRGELVEWVGSLGPFGSIPVADINGILDLLLSEEFIVSDGDLFMVGPATETVFGGERRQELFSALRGGRDYRAITPDGEEVGRLDARFARSEDTGSFSLGGRGWNVIGRDDTHGLVIVEPGNGAVSRRPYWSGTRGGASPQIARAALRLLSARATSLPLDPHTQEVFMEALSGVPTGIDQEGVTIVERWTGPALEVMVLTPFGAQGNGLVASFLHNRLGEKISIRPTDFGILIRRAGKKVGEGARRVHAALEEMRSAPYDVVAATLPPVPSSARAFGPLVPPALFERMIAEDYHGLSELTGMIRRSRFVVHVADDENTGAGEGGTADDQIVAEPREPGDRV
jgi:ATP-dependent Lhr-like helicase